MGIGDPRMTRTTWTRLPGALALLITLACGDSGNPGSDGSTGTTAGPTADDTTTAVPTSEPDDTSGGMTAATTDTPTTESPPVECEQASDCPPSANPCEVPACSELGMCEVTPAPADTPQPDDPGNCVKAVCDGMGGVHSIADDDPPADTPDDCVAPTCEDGIIKEIPADDPPPDDAGDCKQPTCAAGEVMFEADDLDLPDDTVECTQDTCMAGVPTFVPKPANTFCGPDGTDFCHDDTDCKPCKQVSDACEDETNTEANETQATAHDFGTISDADSAGDTICPVLKGADDVDWYMYTGDDVFPNVVDPTRVVTTDLNARLCVYYECINGNTSVGCNADEVEDVAPGGQDGCCGMGNVAPSLNCTGLDDAADVWFKVENVDMLACVPYQLDYHF
jgi:hypothetical protein